MSEDGGDDGDDDEGNLYKIDKETGHKDDCHDEGEEAAWSEVCLHHEVGEVTVTPHPPEDQSKGGCTDEDDEYHAGEVGCIGHDRLESRL